MPSLSLNHIPRPEPVATLNGHSEIVWSVDFLPNGKELVSASNDGSIRLWKLDHESEVILGSSVGAFFCLAIFPDGKRLASGGLDRSVKVWDFDVLAVVDGPWMAHKSSVRYLDVSSDCRYLVSGSFDHNVNIWDTESGRIVQDETCLNGDGKITCVKFSKTDHRLLTGSEDGSLRIWDWETGRLLVGPMKADEMPIWAVAWPRDETLIFSGSSDGVLRQWHASTGHIIGEPVHAHDSIIYSLALSHNGSCLASASSDNTVKIWNTTTLEQMATFAHPNEVNCTSFSIDDRLLATACSDSLIYLWELPEASLDSGLVIDHEGASLLEVSLASVITSAMVNRLQRPMVIPLEGRVVGDQRASGETELLREILGTHTPPFSGETTSLAKERPAEDIAPTVARKKGRINLSRSPRRCSREGGNNIQEPEQEKHKLWRIIKSAFAKISNP